jgi:WD40 repeat protein
VSHLCSLAENTFLSAGSNRSIFLWDIRQATNTKLLQDASRCKLTWIEHLNLQETFATASEDGCINIWDMRMMRKL